MKHEIVTPTPADAAAIREAIVDAMAKWLHARAAFVPEGAFENLAAAGLP